MDTLPYHPLVDHIEANFVPPDHIRLEEESSLSEDGYIVRTYMTPPGAPLPNPPEGYNVVPIRRCLGDEYFNHVNIMNSGNVANFNQYHNYDNVAYNNPTPNNGFIADPSAAPPRVDDQGMVAQELPSAAPIPSYGLVPDNRFPNNSRNNQALADNDEVYEGRMVQASHAAIGGQTQQAYPSRPGSANLMHNGAVYQQFNGQAEPASLAQAASHQVQQHAADVQANPDGYTPVDQHHMDLQDNLPAQADLDDFEDASNQQRGFQYPPPPDGPMIALPYPWML